MREGREERGEHIRLKRKVRREKKGERRRCLAR
jgi:hypothetical protein